MQMLTILKEDAEKAVGYSASAISRRATIRREFADLAEALCKALTNGSVPQLRTIEVCRVDGQIIVHGMVKKGAGRGKTSQ